VDLSLSPSLPAALWTDRPAKSDCNLTNVGSCDQTGGYTAGGLLVTAGRLNPADFFNFSGTGILGITTKSDNP